MPRSDFDDDPPGPEADDQPRPRRRRPQPREEFDEENADAVSTLIPYHNPQALAAYYCGVFGLIPCIGCVLGPAALVLGILGFRKARENPRAKGTGHAITGIVLGAIEILFYVAVVIVGICLYVGVRSGAIR